MNIAHVTPSYLPAASDGRPLQAVHGLAAALVARGHRVEVFTTNLDAKGVSGASVAVPARLDGVLVRYFAVSWLARLYRSPTLAAALRASLARFDVVHLHSLFVWPTVAAARLARGGNRPYVVAPRGSLDPAVLAARGNLGKRLWLAAYERRTLAQAGAIHATCAREAELIESMGLALSDLHVVPNGIHGLARGATTRRDDRTVVFVGRLTPDQGLDELIPAIANVEGARLLVAGTDHGGYERELRRLADVHQIGDRVEFLGPVDGSERGRLLARASVLALPARSEHFADVVVEAMAARCPVVLTREVGIGEEAREAGAAALCEVRAASIATAVSGVLVSAERRRRMGAAGAALVERRLLWSRVAAQMESVYMQVCGAAS